MNLSRIVKNIINNFLLIFACIIIIITVLRQIYKPDLVFDLQSIYIIMAFSLLSALTGLIAFSPKVISEKAMRIRIVIHFFMLEIILITIGYIFNIVNNSLDAFILAMQIAIIYFIVRLLSWRNDKKEAIKINEKLKTFKNNTN